MSAAGLSLDRPMIYGKQFKHFYVEILTTGASGAIDSVKGAGFGTAVARPHRGAVERTGTGTYLITLPGDGGAWNLIAPFVTLVESGGNAYVPIVTTVDHSDGTVEIRVVTNDGADTDSAVDMEAASKMLVFFVTSDWPHFD